MRSSRVIALAVAGLLGLGPVAHAAGIGETWSNPTSTGFTTPDLSQGGQNSSGQQVAISGSTAIAIWYRSNGANFIVQTARSSDGGETWSAPTDLSATGQHGLSPQIAISGSTAIAIWYRSNGTNNIIQTATSSNGGATWSAPVDLSATGQSSANPQIAISGSTAIAIWTRSNGTNNILQSATSSNAVRCIKDLGHVLS